MQQRSIGRGQQTYIAGDGGGEGAGGYTGGADDVEARTPARCKCVDVLSRRIEVLESELRANCAERDVLSQHAELLESENAKLCADCAELRNDVDHLRAVESSLATHVFSIERLKTDDRLIAFYIGFSSFLMFLSCFNFLRRSAEVMRLWRSSRTTPDNVTQLGEKPGPKVKLPLMEQFFMVMVRLCQGLNEVDLAD